MKVNPPQDHTSEVTEVDLIAMENILQQDDANWRARIDRIINNTDTRSARVFMLVVQALILVSLVTFSIETLPNLSSQTKDVLSMIEVVTVGIFTLEYVLRLIVAENKLRFVFSFYGLVDLLAVLPFYIASGLDLRAVRIFRLLRLTRILKLFKYNAAIRRFHRALIIAKEELVLFGFVALILLYLSAVIFPRFSRAES